MADRPPRVELLGAADCPLRAGVRATAYGCLRDAGLDVTVLEREGAYPSPTLLIDGLDVVTGAPAATGSWCRLDLPTESQVRAALARGGRHR